MGREGGGDISVAKSKEEIEKLLEDHERSKRQKKTIRVERIALNENEANKVATAREGECVRLLYDNYRLYF